MKPNCPLLSKAGSYASCMEERCAWYNFRQSNCSIYLIATNLLTKPRI